MVESLFINYIAPVLISLSLIVGLDTPAEYLKDVVQEQAIKETAQAMVLDTEIQEFVERTVIEEEVDETPTLAQETTVEPTPTQSRSTQTSLDKLIQILRGEFVSYGNQAAVVDGLRNEFVSQEEQADTVATLENKLNELEARPQTDTEPIYRAISLTNKIDDLANVDVRNSNITNGTFSGGSGSFTSITASDLNAGNTDISGTLTITGALTNYSAITVPYVTATSTTATSTFAGGLAVDTNTLYIDPYTDRVGIGTTSPAYTLSVEGSSTLGNQALGGYFTATSTTATSTFAGGLTVDTSDFVVDPDANRVGIGTSTPGSLLSLGSVANFTTATSTFYATGGIDISGGCFALNGTCVGTWSKSGTNAYYTAGNVGIGTSTPQSKLSLTSSTRSTATGLFGLYGDDYQRIFTVYEGGAVDIGGVSSTSPANRFTITSGGKEQLQLLNTGTLRLGSAASTSQQYRFYVDGSVGVKEALSFGTKQSFISYSGSDGSVASTVKITDGSNGGPSLDDSDQFGTAVAEIGDLNGDGITDLAVGAWVDEGAGTSEGAVHILFMNADGSAASTVKITDGVNGGPSLDDSDNFGTAIANIGDLNGDGITDLAVGATNDEGPSGSSEGAIHILFMNADGSVASTVKITDGTNGGPSLDNLDYFGTAITNIGDLNGDGITDLAVGATNDEGPSGTGEGAIHILFMNADGSVASTVKISDGVNGGPSLDDNDNFASAIANIGDLNGDGLTDLAVGAKFDEGTGTDEGAVHILFMNADGSAASTVKISDGVNGGPSLDDADYFGFSVANITDLNGDGLTDLAVGAQRDEGTGTDEGAIHILFMNADGSVASTVKISDGVNGGPSLDDNDNFGYDIANIGDLNGDGITDLAVGARLDEGVGTSEGAIHILFMTDSSKLRFGSGGSERLTVDTSGNLGVGTSTPGANLVVNGTTGQNLFQIATSTDQAIFIADTNGNIGVGTSSPYAKLSVSGDIVSTAKISGAYLTIDDSTSYNVLLGVNAGNAITTATNSIAIGNTAMGTGVVTGADNIAIGQLAGNDLTTSAASVLIGKDAGANITTADGTVAIGEDAIGTGIATGVYNVAVGRLSGNDLTSGARNVLIGSAAGTNITTASNNVALGNQAMGLGISTTGSENVAIGTQAGYDITTADHSVFIGEAAGANITTGDYNIAIGGFALDAAVSTSDSIAIGNQAMGTGLVTGVQNIAIGTQAGNDITTGGYNLQIGFSAGANLTTGTSNVFLGRSAAATGIINGSDNVAIGQLAGNDLTSAAQSVLVGANAGSNITTASRSIAIGYNAMNNGITTGTANIAIGFAAGQDFTSGANNITLGSAAGNNAETANNMIAIGEDALGTGIVTGADNIGIGRLSGNDLTSGASNVFLGANSGANVTTGSGNTALGYDALSDGITTGSFNTVIGRASGQALTSGSSNFLAGFASGNSITTGNYNVTIGDSAGTALVGGSSNVALGQNTLDASTAANYTIAIGLNAMGAGVVTGEDNIAIGQLAGNAITSGVNNIAIGEDALQSVTTGSYSVGIGPLAAKGLTGDSNVAIGKYALRSPSGGTGASNIGIGEQAGENITTGNSNIMMGYAGNSLTTGSGNLLLGYEAGNYVQTTSYNIALGYRALRAGAFVYTGSENIGIGRETGYGLTSGTYNFLGQYRAGYSLTTGSNNVLLGQGSGDAATTMTNSVAIGLNAMGAGVVTGSDNIAIGQLAGNDLTSSPGNVLIGLSAGANMTSGSGANIAIGYEAMSLGNVTGTGNIALGQNAGKDLTLGINNVFLGVNAGDEATTGDDNVAIGFGAMSVGITTGDDNVAIGQNAGQSLTSGTGNTLLGYRPGENINTGAFNSFFGYQAGSQVTTGSDNVGIARDALGAGTVTGDDNIAIGYQTGYDLTSGISNVLIGQTAGANITTGSNAIAIGQGALDVSTSSNNAIAIGLNTMGTGDVVGTDNIAIGQNASKSLTSGAYNVVMGWNTFDLATLGSNNIAIGPDAMGDSAVTGDENVSIGKSAGGGISSGANNVAIGPSAGVYLSTGSNNVFIGHDAGVSALFATGSNTMALGNGANPSTSSVSNEITLGNSSITTIRAQVTSITALSDQRDKADIADLNVGLDLIKELRPAKFKWDQRDRYENGISDGSLKDTDYSFGFIAQEVLTALEDVDAEWMDFVYQTNPDRIELRQGDLLVPAIRAIQELDIRTAGILSSTSTPQFYITENGNVGIGTTSPNYELHVVGDVAATSFVNTSTKTAKKDIVTLGEANEEALYEKLKNVEVAEYHYNFEESTTPKRLGLIAEDAPSEVLSVDGKGVDIYKLSTFTLAGVKTLDKKLTELDLRVANLETLIGSSTPQSGSLSMTSVLDYLAGLGVTITDTIARFTNVFAETLTVGSSDNPAGITLYDKATNEPRCFEIENNIPISTPGACEDLTSPTTTPSTDTGEPPTIVISGNNPALVEKGALYTDLGIIITDDKDDNLGHTTFVDGVELLPSETVEIDTTTVGDHEIVYTVLDTDGNSTSATRIVTVFDPNATTTPQTEETATTTPDTTAPTITLIGQTPLTLSVGDTYTDEGATASDDTDGDITANITTLNSVDTTTAGTYTVTYNVSDEAGNAAEEVVRTVTVEEVVVEEPAPEESATTTPSE